MEPDQKTDTNQQSGDALEKSNQPENLGTEQKTNGPDDQKSDIGEKQTDAEFEKSVGEQRMRTDFNASGLELVNELKQKTAELINICEQMKEKDPRLAAIAQTQFETAGMYAVKLATA